VFAKLPKFFWVEFVLKLTIKGENSFKVSKQLFIDFSSEKQKSVSETKHFKGNRKEGYITAMQMNVPYLSTELNLLNVSKFFSSCLEK
jgi:hypothetical protein